ncbi:hypothetical protein ACFQ1T_01280 [Methylophilus glucosoxydans]|jgi:hypothetical protein|uniref:Uncharacterized protein n=1 Tax=Methylophilus glucosoxydans TaxID=752553 RepID=A0ABW3GH81_9PROT
MNAPFNPADRTYHVSEERLRAFMALTPLQRLQWVEQVAYFLRLAKSSKAHELPQVDC